MPGKGGFLGQSAQSRGFAEIVAAHVQPGQPAGQVHAQGHHHFAAVTVHRGSGYIAYRAALFIHAQVTAVNAAAGLYCSFFKIGGFGHQAAAGFHGGAQAVFLNGLFRNQVKDAQQQRRRQTNGHQRNQGFQGLAFHVVLLYE